MNDLLQTIKELRKEKARWYRKIHYLNNIEKQRESSKKYRLENKEKERERHKKYSLKNKEKLKKYKKEYRLNNKEKLKESSRKYNKTPAGFKISKIATWKNIGVIHNDFDKLFELYMNTTNCQNCNILLTSKDRYNKLTTKCLDHNHITGEFRNILCNLCNIRRK